MVLTLSRQFVTLTGTGKAVRVFLDDILTLISLLFVMWGITIFKELE